MQISQCWLLIAFYNPECINSKWLDIGQVPFLEVKEEEKKSRSIKRERGGPERANTRPYLQNQQQPCPL